MRSVDHLAVAGARRRATLFVTLVAMAAVVGSAGTTALAKSPVAPSWDHDLELDSRDGYAQLSWSLPEAVDDTTHWVYHLQEGREPVFGETEAQYRGPQHSSFLSGLENGAYYYRVRARHPEEDEWGPWSEILHVTVRHHDRNFALALMSVGGAVFLATAGFLLSHRNDPVPGRDEGRAHS